MKAVKGSCRSCFSSNILKFLQSSKVYGVVGDGHCLVYSWEVVLRASNATDFKPSQEALLCLIDTKVKRNEDKYSSFLVSTNIDKDAKKYLQEKKYSSEIGDIIINVLANSTSTEAYIYKRNQSNEYNQTNFIEPRQPAINGDVHLLGTGEHYQPIVPGSFIFEDKYYLLLFINNNYYYLLIILFIIVYYCLQFIILHIQYFLNFLLSVQCRSLFMYRNQLAV